METIRSQDYQDILKVNLPEIQAPPDVIESLEIQQMRAKNLQRIATTTGVQFENVAISTDDPRMAACVNTATKDMTITEVMLNDENFTFACYAANHEKEHCSNCFFKINLKEKLKPQEIATLETAISIPGLADVNLMEGFNDLITSDQHGKNPNSAYQHHEVPVVEKLENLAKETLGLSLKELFKAGKQAEFFTRLQDLAQILMVKKLLFTHNACSSLKRSVNTTSR